MLSATLGMLAMLPVVFGVAWVGDGVPMTADSTSWVAESASSTIDPDVQARRASDGEPSARFHSDVTIDEDAVDGLLTAAECAVEFEENRDEGELYAQCRRLAEQAALRRLATLVARGVEPLEVFGALAEEMRRCLPADTAGLWRFESDREITIVAAAADPEALARWPVGTRTPVDGNTLAAVLHRSGRPARIDSYDNVAGSIAARGRAVGVRAAVAVPIIVDSRVWGLAAVGSLQHGPMPADTEVRIGRFAELIATALVAGHRDEQNRQLLAEASRRSNLIDSLLEGRAFDEWSLREVAGQSSAADQRSLSWSSPPTFPPRAMSRCPRSSRSCAASTSLRRGGGCPICRSGSCTSRPTENSTGLLPCCRG